MARWTSAMRGSVAAVAASGGGDGSRISHSGGERAPGRVASRACRWVEPVRGSPVMTIGAFTS